MIPKILYQTWDTNMFAKSVKKRLEIIKQNYTGYNYQFFLDNDMDTFVETHYPGEIWECYKKLNIIVAKVDFWRYLVLYKFGGVYLDIDSDLRWHLDDMIHEGDDAIISAETNPGIFVQWMLAFRAGHPILKRVIEIVVLNIKQNKYPNDIHKMTGPSAFTEAVQGVHQELFGECLQHNKIELGDDVTYEKNEVKYRVLGIDYNGFVTCKIPECFTLFEGRKKWHHMQKEQELLKDVENQSSISSSSQGQAKP